MEIGVLLFSFVLQWIFLHPTLSITELDPFGNFFFIELLCLQFHRVKPNSDTVEIRYMHVCPREKEKT